jgi:hypothetical protein
MNPITDITADDLFLSQVVGEVENLDSMDCGELLSDFDRLQRRIEVNDKDVPNFNLLPETEIDNVLRDRIPIATRQNTRWGYKAWVSWAKNKEDQDPRYAGVPLDFTIVEPQILDYWLCFFFVEARKVDGSKYAPRTLYQLACALLRYMRDNCNRHDLNFLEERSHVFAKSWRVLNGVMTKNHAEGHGNVVNKAPAVLPKDESILWEKGTISIGTAQGLSYGVFYYNCKCFMLRGRDEHRNLSVEQYSFGIDHLGKFVRYVGRESKNQKRGIKQKNVVVKDLKQYENVECPERCVVALFETYLANIPTKGAFYRRTLESPPGMIRFSEQVIGVKLLANRMKDMFDDAGVVGQYRNHSGKVSINCIVLGLSKLINCIVLIEQIE